MAIGTKFLVGPSEEVFYAAVPEPGGFAHVGTVCCGSTLMMGT